MNAGMNAGRRMVLLGMSSLAGLAIAARPAHAASRAELDDAGAAALQTLYGQQPQLKTLANQAVAVLVFPKIVKGGFIVGAQTGDGVLFLGGTPSDYYNISSASYGLQAGIQSYSYALFFMNEPALQYLDQSGGWSVGSGPTVVVLDQGAAASVTSTTLTKDVYAVPFGQQGLMAGIGLEGSKITRIYPGP
jgi:lipid-binding SYLF domain-containing protein